MNLLCQGALRLLSGLVAGLTPGFDRGAEYWGQSRSQWQSGQAQTSICARQIAFNVFSRPLLTPLPRLPPRP